MNRLGIVLVSAAFVFGSGINALAQGSATPPPPNFGSPPSGPIAILYNDHHVYSKPDVMKQNRVLAALVRSGAILVPLRSMFEQMGATVSYDPASKTATISKPGAEVKVTVGKPVVTVNGESRPLDVPPIVYQGNVLVPVRVLSEGMGAYVQWDPDKWAVVVRYLTATPPPSPPPPTPAPTEAPTPTPSPAATPYNDLYVAGDYLFSPKSYNEFSPGNTSTGASWDAHGNYEFKLFQIPFMVGMSFEQIQFQHNGSIGNLNAPCNGLGGNASPRAPGCVTTIGGTSSVNVAAFNGRDSDLDAQLGMKLLTKQRLYIAFDYRWTWNNYGYPKMSGFGEGIDKLPDLDQRFSFFGDWIYYPKVAGKISTGVIPNDYRLQYILTTYQIGAAYVPLGSPIFFEAGWQGDAMVNRENAPSNRKEYGPFAGLGLKFP